MTVIEIPATVYAAIRALLLRAELDPDRDHDGILDMHGLTLKSRGGAPHTDITVGSLLSSQTHEGRIELVMNGEITQMDLDKAREIVGMLNGAIEAAVSDAFVFKFLTERVGLEANAAAAALLDFREMRQGSRERVHPH